MKDFEDLTWDDDLGGLEYARWEAASQEDGYVELPDDESRRAMFELTELDSNSIETKDDIEDENEGYQSSS